MRFPKFWLNVSVGVSGVVGYDQLAPVGCEYPKVVAVALVGIAKKFKLVLYLTVFTCISIKYTKFKPLLVVT